MGDDNRRMGLKTYLLAARVPLAVKRDFEARCRDERVSQSLVLRKLAEEYTKGTLHVDVRVNLTREGTKT